MRLTILEKEFEKCGKGDSDFVELNLPHFHIDFVNFDTLKPVLEAL